MKIVGAAFVLISSGGIGFLYAQQLIKRVREMEELYQLLKLILGDIRYMRTTLPEAVEKARKRHKGSFQTFLFEVEKRLRESPGISFADIWKEAIKNGLSLCALKEEDKQKLMCFGDAISAVDRETLMQCFEQYLYELQQEASELQRACAAKVKLYRCLGIMSGFFLVILFI